MPPKKNRKIKKNKKARLSTPVDLSLLWKAAFCQSAQLGRGEWLHIDLAAGLQAIREALQSNGGVSLSYLSTVYLGLCRIMTSQLHHFYDNATMPRLDFEVLNKQFCKRGDRKGKDGAASRFPDVNRADPQLRQFFDTCAKIEAFKVQQQQQQPMTETGAQRLASLLSPDDLSSLNHVVEADSMGTDNESEATAYFEGLYGQVSSVNFDEECADILEEHFNGVGKKKKLTDDGGSSKRFAALHQHRILPLITTSKVHSDGSVYEPPDELPQPDEQKKEEEEEKEEEAVIVDEPSTVDELPAVLPELNSEVPLPIALPVPVLQAKRRRPRKVRRKRTKAKQTRAKRLSGLKRHLEEYCKSKGGYQFAVEENADSELTEPSRSMSEHLTPYFSSASTNSSNSECSEQPQQESQDQSSSLEALAEQQQPSLAIAVPDCTEMQTTTNSASSPDVDLRDSISPPIEPPVNDDFAAENAFCDTFVDMSEVPKQPQCQVQIVKPLKRQPFPIVKDYRQMQVKTDEIVGSVPASAELKISDNQILSVLNSTLGEQSTNELSFSNFVSSIGQSAPSRQNVALTFCSLLNLSAQPNSGVKLHVEKKKENCGTSLPSKKLSEFSDLTILLTKSSGQSKLNQN